MLGTDLVDKGTQPGCVKFARQGTPPSPQGEEGHWLSGVCCGVSLLCQPACTLLHSHITGGRGLRVFFPQTHPHCVLPSQTLILFPIISPSALGPDIVSDGVRFKEKLIKRSFSPMTVVQLRSST